jgi:uncharacterized protein (UPF0276 family)
VEADVVVVAADVDLEMPKYDSLPVLQAGIGFRPPLLADLFKNRSAVDFVEIVADHYLAAPPEKLREFDLLKANFPVIPHALGLSLGSADGLDRRYLEQLAQLVNRLDPPWWSEHIAFTRAGDVDIGHLAPLPFTIEAVETLCRNIATARELIAAPLILENISYTVALPFGELTEAEFVREVLNRSDCGLLLDVTNLYANSVNHGFDARAFLDELPLERVVQLHFVGGHWDQGVWIDSHSTTTPDEVWKLLEDVFQRAPVKAALLERDENFPDFVELADELSRVRSIGKRCGTWT